MSSLRSRKNAAENIFQLFIYFLSCSKKLVRNNKSQFLLLLFLLISLSAVLNLFHRFFPRILFVSLFVEINSWLHIANELVTISQVKEQMRLTIPLIICLKEMCDGKTIIFWVKLNHALPILSICWLNQIFVFGDHLVVKVFSVTWTLVLIINRE